MTSRLYDALTAKGYQCEIMTGISSLLSFALWQESGHAWLIAKKQGDEFWIQSTKKKVMRPACFDKYCIRLN